MPAACRALTKARVTLECSALQRDSLLSRAAPRRLSCPLRYLGLTCSAAIGLQDDEEVMRNRFHTERLLFPA